MNEQESNWRLFCAIEIPTDVRRKLSARIKRLQELFPNVSASWTREDNFHLTIKFIGELTTSRTLSLSHAASRAAEAVNPFEILIERPGAFPRRVLWIGVADHSRKLAHLQQQLDRECAFEGFPADERGFHPHLTIARLRKPHGIQELTNTHKDMPFEDAVVKVNELLVIRSQLSSKGSIYTIVSRHKLGGD
jgi:2'-5' RNA ligase